MRKNYKGFTLIEILIITAIMGILTAIGVPIYQDYVISSKENTAKDNLQSIAFMQGDHLRESDQYFPCPKKTLNTSQIDKQFFGGQGDLSSGDYSYKMTGGCSGFLASALIFNSKAKCFKIDQNRRISIITCPNGGALTVSAQDPKAPICTMIPGKIYNEDGSQHAFNHYGGSPFRNPLAGHCVRYDKKTKTYYAMLPNSIQARSDQYNMSFTATNYLVSAVLTHHVKSSGYEITEGSVVGGRAVDKNGQRFSHDDHMGMESWDGIQTKDYYKKWLQRK